MKRVMPMTRHHPQGLSWHSTPPGASAGGCAEAVRSAPQVSVPRVVRIARMASFLAPVLNLSREGLRLLARCRFTSDQREARNRHQTAQDPFERFSGKHGTGSLHAKTRGPSGNVGLRTRHYGEPHDHPSHVLYSADPPAPATPNRSSREPTAGVVMVFDHSTHLTPAKWGNDTPARASRGHRSRAAQHTAFPRSQEPANFRDDVPHAATALSGPNRAHATPENRRIACCRSRRATSVPNDG